MIRTKNYENIFKFVRCSGDCSFAEEAERIEYLMSQLLFVAVFDTARNDATTKSNYSSV